MRNRKVKNLNQILSVETPKKEKNKKPKNNSPIEIQKIVRFFSIVILIFGICMIGSGSYSMYKGTSAETGTAKPTIYVQETSGTEITLQVSHNKALEKVTYKWNNEDETEINSNGKKQTYLSQNSFVPNHYFLRFYEEYILIHQHLLMFQ